jgi:tRNA dimethylallyltransferase
MDIGTAKPSSDDQRRIRHHGLDIRSPDERFTAAQFKQFALGAIDDISDRGKLPLLVGGTGLYVDAVLYDYQFREPGDPAMRAVLQNMDVETLQQKLHEQNIPLPANSRNPRHLVRALETKGEVLVRSLLRGNTMVLGLAIDRAQIISRIRSRVTAMLDLGLEAEVQALANTYGWDAPGMQAIGYREWRPYFDDGQTLAQTQEMITKSTNAYAKRQRTWFRRNNSIQWHINREEILSSVVTYTTKLNK